MTVWLIIVERQRFPSAQGKLGILIQRLSENPEAMVCLDNSLKAVPETFG